MLDAYEAIDLSPPPFKQATTSRPLHEAQIAAPTPTARCSEVSSEPQRLGMVQCGRAVVEGESCDAVLRNNKAVKCVMDLPVEPAMLLPLEWPTHRNRDECRSYKVCI